MSNPDDSLNQWNQIVADYRQACLLRREGRAEEAGRLINETLPKSIAMWSREDRRPAHDKKAALRSMFSTEQSSIDSWVMVHRTLATRLADSLIPALRQHVGEEVREVLADQAHVLPDNNQNQGSSPRCTEAAGRIRFDDIPGVIEALLAEQKADFGPQPAFAY